MHNIIVPTDFSIKSYNALRLAKRIASGTRGVIHIVHVVEPVSGQYSSMGENLGSTLDDVYIVQLVEKLTEELQNLKALNEGHDHQILSYIKVGDPYCEIKEMVEHLKADIIIVGAKGFMDAEEFFLGSITDKLVRTAPCPVITVKEVIDEGSFQNIVYATDLEADNKPMMNLLMRLQDLFDAQLHLVMVNTPKNFHNDIDTQRRMEQLVQHYQLKNYTLNIYNHEDREYGIVYFADGKQADLIAMGVHEQSGFRRLISGGSLADEVTEHTFRPVLTYRTNLQ
ncbi:MAG: universal stress protein [Cytophagales bacterium]|nr:universal stress protein [Cytophagales bacterium]